jgi:hypothetical protein
MYSISKKQYDLAKELGVIIKPSQRKNKKIDIYGMDNEYHTSIGDIRFLDYFSYFETHGKDFANNRRRLYLLRHKKELLSIGSRGWFSAILLWDYHP